MKDMKGIRRAMNTEFKKGDRSAFAGRRHSIESKQKMSESLKKLNRCREKSASWKGGRTISTQGYVCINMPQHPKSNHNYVLEHRLVMEKHLGRFLEKGEVVHHIDKDKLNNRIENLRLTTASSHAHEHSLSRSVNKIHATCLVCNKEISYYPSKPKKFCSHKCYSLSLIGKLPARLKKSI